MSALLFNSLNEPIPGLRRDLEIVPIRHEEKDYLYFYDMLGYVKPNFVLDHASASILSLLNGRNSVQELMNGFNSSDVEINDLVHFIEFLDDNCVLESRYFQHFSKNKELAFEEAEKRPPVCAGSSYPADRPGIIAQFSKAFGEFSGTSVPLNGEIKALYAPHIDPRVGIKSYIKAFLPLKDLKPKRVVILATSHYSGLYRKVYENKPFIVSDKHFETPLGLVENDRKSVLEMKQSELDLGCSYKDRAHRIEHSIELHLIFLQYLWQHDFKILPILVGSFDELLYTENGKKGEQIQNFTGYLNQKFANDPDTLFMISGDLAHIGRKFGDPIPASNLFEEVREFDHQFLDRAKSGDKKQVLNLMKESMDRYRICGFPPLLTFLNTLPGVKGDIMSYDLWDESERESAVTFGSILYRK